MPSDDAKREVGPGSDWGMLLEAGLYDQSTGTDVIRATAIVIADGSIAVELIKRTADSEHNFNEIQRFSAEGYLLDPITGEMPVKTVETKNQEAKRVDPGIVAFIRNQLLNVPEI